MPKQNLNPKAIAGVICLIVLMIAAAYSGTSLMASIAAAKNIDEQIARSTGVIINKSNLDKAIRLLKSQEDPVPEQFWLEFEQSTSFNEEIVQESSEPEDQ